MSRGLTGELLVYQFQRSVVPASTIFKNPPNLLAKYIGGLAKFIYVCSQSKANIYVKWNGNLFRVSRSHDQDTCNAHML